MEEAEHTHYVAQLKAEFDSCDTTATGFLDRDELTALCQKLQLDAHLPLLLDTLLGERTYARVNFEEFKEGFVAVLSRSLDFSTSEDDSSYLEPVVPEEVKPKFVKGTKRYGRRSRPDSKYGAALTCDSEDSPPSRTEATDSSPAGVRRAKLRRSTSLESVEVRPVHDVLPVPLSYRRHLVFRSSVRLSLMISQKLDADLDGRVSIRDFQKVLCGSAPVSCSTPVRPSQSVLEERSARSTSPSLLTATVGQRILSRLDDGSGCTSPEQVIGLWTEEGIRNSRDILQTLDFPLEERLSLADLTLALDNELLVGGNGIHQAALISYKNEIQHLQVVAEQACRERDKVKADLDLADQRNLQLVREVDDRHASMETLNQSRIRDLEQDFRDRLTALRSQSEQESEALLQQVERERDALQEELQLLRAQEAELQEDLCSVTQVCTHHHSPAPTGDLMLPPCLEISELEEQKAQVEQQVKQLKDRERAELEQNFAREISNLVQRLSSEKEQLEAELRLKMDQEVMLVSREESEQRLSQMKLQHADGHRRLLHQLHRERQQLQEQRGFWENQLVQSEQEKLQCEEERARICSQFSSKKKKMEEQQQEAVRQLKEQVCRLQEVVQSSALQVSQSEASVEEFRERCGRCEDDLEASRGRCSELEDRLEEACTQLEESIAFLESHEALSQRLASERSLVEEELQVVKVREEQLEVQVKQLNEELGNLRIASDSILQDRSGAVTRQEAQLAARDQTVSALRSELEDLQETLRTRTESVSKLTAELDLLKTDRARLIQDLKEQAMAVDDLQLELDGVSEELDKRRSAEEGLQEAVKQERTRTSQLRSSLDQKKEEVCRLNQENRSYTRLADQLSTQIVEMEEEISTLRDHLRDLSSQLNETADLVLDLRRQLNSRTSEVDWLRSSSERHSGDVQQLTDQLDRVREQVHSLQQALQDSRDQLRTREQNFEQEKRKMTQQLMELETLVLALEDVMDPASPHRFVEHEVEELENGVRKLMKEKEELCRAQEEQEEQASITLQEEIRRLRVQNQELQNKLQVQGLEVHNLTQEQQNLKTEVRELETARMQAARADTALSLVQAQHLRQLQQLRERMGEGRREEVELLQVRLEEEQRRSQQLEETLRLHAQQSSSQISIKQDQYEKALASLQQRMEDLETKLKGVRMVLQEKVQQLKEQLVKNNKSAALLKDLYVENSQLMKALQVTEQRQKNAEKKNFLLEEKVAALNKLLREIVPASLAT
uniref:Ninein-like n=1 Tax=Seriola dumerili TaxID=41447 RepID=A0A3B4TFI4_SERDU